MYTSVVAYFKVGIPPRHVPESTGEKKENFSQDGQPSVRSINHPTGTIILLNLFNGTLSTAQL
jgi:hypothetical protein